MTRDSPPRIASPGLGEAPPTAGLLPRWRDLLPVAQSETLEAALCRRIGVEDIEVVATGTAGLLLAFLYLRDQHPGRDVVIMPAYTCPLVAIAAHAAGLCPLACDTAPGSLDLDLDRLADLVTDRTLAVVPTHFGGWITDVDAVRRACPGTSIVEDAAQAFGATWAGRSVGLAGDIGIFSFGAGKGFTIYEGGALVARDPAVMAGLQRIAMSLAQRNRLAELGRAILLLGYHAAYSPLGLRLVYGMPKRRALARENEIEAAGDLYPPEVGVTCISRWRKHVGLAALPRLDAHVAASRARFDALAWRLEAIPGLHVHRPQPPAAPSATCLFVTLPAHPERASLVRALWTSRLGVARMFSRALPDYPDIAPLLEPSDTPNARALAAGTITITTSALLSPAAEAVIVSTLEGFARATGRHG